MPGLDPGIQSGPGIKPGRDKKTVERRGDKKTNGWDGVETS